MSHSATIDSNAADAVTQCPPQVRQGWCYPRPVQRFAEKLLDQQLWCWGRDILSPNGNLLMDRGFERHREKDSDSKKSTCYRLDDGERHVALWGFGIFYGERELGGLFIRRFGFSPVWYVGGVLKLGIHAPQKLPPSSRPKGTDEWARAHELSSRMMEWIADYESELLESVGLEYRQECIADWLRPITSAEGTPDAWRSLAARGWDDDLDQWKAESSRWLHGK